MTAASRGTLLRNLLLLRELERFLERFEGGTPVLLKGAALVAAGVADARLRQAQDVDLLLRAGELAEAERALAGLGFSRLPFNPSQWRRGGLDFDLHERLWYLEPGEEEALRRRCRRARVQDRWALVPDPTDHLVFVAAHAAVSHGELDPKWLQDGRGLVAAGAEPERALRELIRLGMGEPGRWFLSELGLSEPPGPAARRLLEFEMPNKGHLLRLVFSRGWLWRLGSLRGALFPGREFLRRRYEASGPLSQALWTGLRPAALAWELARGLAGLRRPNPL